MKLRNFSVITGLTLALVLGGCGGGGSSNKLPDVRNSEETLDTTQAFNFTESFFANKTMYLVSRDEDGPGYEKARFSRDGTGMGSYIEIEGDPELEDPFTWKISNGKLQLIYDGTDVVMVQATFQDTDRSYVRLQATHGTNSITGGIFYSQTTAFQQAQDFVRLNQPL